MQDNFRVSLKLNRRASTKKLLCDKEVAYLFCLFPTEITLYRIQNTFTSAINTPFFTSRLLFPSQSEIRKARVCSVSPRMCILSITDDVDALRRCVTSGFFANAASLHYSGVYRTVRDDHTLHIHPTSVLSVETPPQWLVFITLKYNFFMLRESNDRGIFLTCLSFCFQIIYSL